MGFARMRHSTPTNPFRTMIDQIFEHIDLAIPALLGLAALDRIIIITLIIRTKKETP